MGDLYVDLLICFKAAKAPKNHKDPQRPTKTYKMPQNSRKLKSERSEKVKFTYSYDKDATKINFHNHNISTTFSSSAARFRPTKCESLMTRSWSKQRERWRSWTVDSSSLGSRHGGRHEGRRRPWDMRDCFHTPFCRGARCANITCLQTSEPRRLLGFSVFVFPLGKSVKTSSPKTSVKWREVTWSDENFEDFEDFELFHRRGPRHFFDCRVFRGKTAKLDTASVKSVESMVLWEWTSWSNGLVPPFMSKKCGIPQKRPAFPAFPAFQWLGAWVHIGVQVLKIHHEHHKKTYMDHPNLCISMPIYAMQCCRDEEDCWCTSLSSNSRQPLILHIIDILDTSLTMDWTKMKSAKMWFIKVSQKGLFKTNIPKTFPKHS